MSEGGLCAQTDPELFFPDKGQRSDKAAAICAACPVIEECRVEVFHVERNLCDREVFGYAAGMTARERVELRRPALGVSTGHDDRHSLYS